MGYQESFLYFDSNNVESNNRDIFRLMTLFEEYGVRCKNDDLATVTHLCTFSQPWNFFPLGMHVLLIKGERAQQSGKLLFDIFEEEEYKRLLKRFGNAWIQDMSDSGTPILTESAFFEDEMDLILRVETASLDDLDEGNHGQHVSELFIPSNNILQTIKITLNKKKMIS